VRRVVGVGVVLAGVALAGRAGAVEHESSLGVEVGPAILVISDKSSPDVGATFGLHYTYGLSDAFNLVGHAGWSLVALNAADPSAPPTHPTNVTNVDAGLAYVLDVLQWVPWISLEVGGYALQGGTIGGVKLEAGGALGLGLDYRLNRSWSVGVDVHQHLLLDMSTYPSFTQAMVRFEYVWGW
jgi:hypothetical protein